MATEPKTRPTDASVPDFLAAVENPTRRADAQVVCRMLEAVTGDTPILWGTSIVGFGRYRGPTGDWPVIGFSPRKAQLVVYLMTGFAEAGDLLAHLGKHKIGGSCLYINKLADVDLDVLRELATVSVAQMRVRYPTV